MIVVYIALGIILANVLADLFLPAVGVVYLLSEGFFGWIKRHKFVTAIVALCAIIALS